ncbi:hypothetical protein FPANT_11570, partial [Fusarium pseudoanthophilum]
MIENPATNQERWRHAPDHERIHIFTKWLCDACNKDSLFIIDDIEAFGYSKIPAILKYPVHYALVSTRDSNLNRADRFFRDILLPPLTNGDAKDLLKWMLANLSSNTLQWSGLDSVADKLHGHPLAIRNAIPFILERLLTYEDPIAEFIDLFDSYDLEERKLFLDFSFEGRSLWEAFDTSFQRLLLQENSGRATKLIQILPFLSSDKDYANQVLHMDKPFFHEWQEKLPDVSILRTGPRVISTWLSKLRAVSFFILSSSQSTSKDLNIHPLILQYMLLRLDDETRLSLMRQVLHLCYMLEDKGAVQESRIKPHVLHCVRVCQGLGIPLETLGLPADITYWVETCCQNQEELAEVEVHHHDESTTFKSALVDKFITSCSQAQRTLLDDSSSLPDETAIYRVLENCRKDYRAMRNSIEQQSGIPVPLKLAVLDAIMPPPRLENEEPLSFSDSIFENAQSSWRETPIYNTGTQIKMESTSNVHCSEKTVFRVVHLLRSFDYGRVPIDLLTRACESKLTWSSSGEVVERYPLGAGVPKWLITFYKANKSWLQDQEQKPTNGHGYQISENVLFSSLVDERRLAHVRIAMALHAFPSINSEIIGDEMVDRLMDTAKASVLPLLSSLTEADIQDWLLPDRQDDPLGDYITLYKVMAEALETSSSQVSKPQLFDVLPTLVDSDIRTNAMILYTLSMLLPEGIILAGTGAPTERLSRSLPNWHAWSPTYRSTMEFLTETSLSGSSKLDTNRRLIFKRVDAQALYGFLLSQHRQYDEAAIFLRATIADVTSKYGATSIQIGLVTAELANCYNILRQEEKAEQCIKTTLLAQKDWRLSTRRDGIYLRLSLADTFIGRARYNEAVPILEGIVKSREISATLRMMSVLRLARSRRRMHEDAQKAFEHDSALWTGSTLLSHVSGVLTMEYIEELACSISEMHGVLLGGSEESRELIEAVDSALCKTASLTDTPSWNWYTKAKKEYLGRIEKATELKKEKGKGANKHTHESDEGRIGSPSASPFDPLREEANLPDAEWRWSERLARSA